MAYSIVNFVSGEATGTVSNVTATNFTATAGNALVCFVWSPGSTTTPVMSDTAGSNDTWTQAGTGAAESGNTIHGFYLLNCAGGSCTVNAYDSSTFSYPFICVFEVSGIATADALVGYAFNGQASPGTSTDAVTSTNTGTLSSQPAAVLAATCNIGFSVTSAPTVGTGYTSAGTIATGNVGRGEHKRVTATTAVAGTFTAVDGTMRHMTGAIVLAESNTQSQAPRTAHVMKLFGAM